MAKSKNILLRNVPEWLYDLLLEEKLRIQREKKIGIVSFTKAIESLVKKQQK